MTLLNGAPVLGAESKKTRFYTMEQYFMKSGPQLERMHEFTQSVLPLLNRHHAGPKLYLQALVAPHMPQFVSICGYESLEQLWSLRAKIKQDAEFTKKFEAFERGPEQPYEQMASTLLEAADYSPEITPSAAEATARIFELRVYHSPTWRQLQALHQRFGGPEIKIFHRVGIHPVLYSSGVFGANLPNLTYLIPFPDLAAREKAWNTFGADPEWIKLRKESVEQHGQMSSVMEMSLYKATAYSPVR